MTRIRWEIAKWYLKWNLKHNFIRHRWFIYYPTLFPLIHLLRIVFQQNKYKVWWGIEEDVYVKHGGKPRGYLP